MVSERMAEQFGQFKLSEQYFFFTFCVCQSITQTQKHTTPTFSPLHQLPRGRFGEANAKEDF